VSAEWLVPVWRAVFVFLEPLELLDQVDFELGADPHPEFEGDVVVGVSATVTTRRRSQADCMGLFDPLLHTELEAVQPGLTFNYGEFAGIKLRVVDCLPDAEEFHSVAVAQPVGDEKFASRVTLLVVTSFQRVQSTHKLLYGRV